MIRFDIKCKCDPLTMAVDNNKARFDVRMMQTLELATVFQVWFVAASSLRRQLFDWTITVDGDAVVTLFEFSNCLMLLLLHAIYQLYFQLLVRTRRMLIGWCVQMLRTLVVGHDRYSPLKVFAFQRPVLRRESWRPCINSDIMLNCIVKHITIKNQIDFALPAWFSEHRFKTRNPIRINQIVGQTSRYSCPVQFGAVKHLIMASSEVLNILVIEKKKRKRFVISTLTSPLKIVDIQKKNSKPIIFLNISRVRDRLHLGAGEIGKYCTNR